MWHFAFQSFSNIEHLLHHTRRKHSYTPIRRIQTSQTYIHTIVMLLETFSSNLKVILGQFRTTTDTNRHQATPTSDVLRHPKRLFEDVSCVAVQVDIKWHLLVSFGV